MMGSGCARGGALSSTVVDWTVNYSLRPESIADVIEGATFRRWIRGLRDRAAVARINARLRNVSLGTMGDAW